MCVLQPFVVKIGFSHAHNRVTLSEPNCYKSEGVWKWGRPFNDSLAENVKSSSRFYYDFKESDE